MKHRAANQNRIWWVSLLQVSLHFSLLLWWLVFSRFSCVVFISHHAAEGFLFVSVAVCCDACG